MRGHGQRAGSACRATKLTPSSASLHAVQGPARRQGPLCGGHPRRGLLLGARRLPAGHHPEPLGAHGRKPHERHRLRRRLLLARVCELPLSACVALRACCCLTCCVPPCSVEPPSEAACSALVKHAFFHPSLLYPATLPCRCTTSLSPRGSCTSWASTPATTPSRRALCMLRCAVHALLSPCSFTLHPASKVSASSLRPSLTATSSPRPPHLAPITAGPGHPAAQDARPLPPVAPHRRAHPRAHVARLPPRPGARAAAPARAACGGLHRHCRPPFTAALSS